MDILCRDVYLEFLLCCKTTTVAMTEAMTNGVANEK